MRNLKIDIIRTVAIIAVILYHLGVLPYGYLGVDVFLVVSGYFMMKSYLKSRERRESYWRMLLAKIARLWPVVILAGAVCLIVGFFTMLPDDLENLSESVIASNAFMTNILSMITTKDYWAVSNNYRPLMHTWYLGILLQAYVLLFAFFLFLDRFGRKMVKYGCIGLAAVSLLLYVLPFNTAQTFYLLPFRAYEFIVGALIVLSPKKKVTGQFAWNSWGVAAVIALLVVIPAAFMSNKIRLIFVVALTALYVICAEQEHQSQKKWIVWLSIPGKCSLSIYIWHQVILAFYRYIVAATFSAFDWLVYFVMLLLCSIVSYQLIEVRLTVFQKTPRKQAGVLLVTCLVCVVEAAVAGVLYLHAGVVRDIPELGITVDNAYRGMHARYVDRVYGYTNPYMDENKKNIFIYGDSMGRDWGNILLESEFSEQIELYYVHPTQYDDSIHEQIMKNADIVFYSTLGDATKLPVELQEVDAEKLYIVGIKNFGECNGNIYNRRFETDYFSSRIKMGKSFVEGKTYYEQNDEQRECYEDHYIDMITPLLDECGEMPVFSDSKMYISADCEHLTQAGAEYYSKILDLSWIVQK